MTFKDLEEKGVVLERSLRGEAGMSYLHLHTVQLLIDGGNYAHETFVFKDISQ